MTAATVDESARKLRLALLGLGALSIAGAVAELAMERHWGDFIKLIPWFAIGGIMVALLLVLVKPSRAGIQVARLICVVVAGATLFGVYEHAAENRKAGALDFRYAEKWDSMSAPSQWWKAATKTVGPAPVLAPGVLIAAGLCVVAATWEHPALRKR